MRRATTRNPHYTRERNAVVRGPKVFEALQHAQNQIRDIKNEFDSSSRDFDKKMDQLVSLRSTEFIELARLYVPDLSLDTIEKSMTGVRRELQEIFRRKQQREQELESSIELATHTIAEAQKETDNVTEKLNELVEERDRLQEIVSSKLKQLPEYVDLANQAALAEQRLSQNEERMKQVNQESLRKLPSYENSQLFMYLYNRKYGTSEYEARGLFKRLDRWLARYIGFTKARRSYDFMKVTPGLMADELNRRRENFDQLMSQIEAIEEKVENEVGLTQIVEEGDQLGLRRDELVNQIEDQNLLLQDFTTELNESRVSKGQHYENAISKMRDHLEKTDATILQRHASETVDTEDDEIVADIVELNREISNLEPEILKLVGKRNSLNEKQAGLNDIVRRFRSSNFDSRRSVFPDDFEIGMYIGRFMNDVITARMLWKEIRQQQKFEESWAQQTATDILNDPSAQIVMHTMLDIAKEALKGSARRSVYRRNSSRSGGISWPQIPSSSKRRSRSSSRRSSSKRRSTPRRRSGGFTTGDGF